ncbi:hypothetical protein ACH5RR_025004 [Cinchona calisaya]|uniref:Uncharacterized protein n=1 Tax=Cinchona calisaya TaxID=153742 RepID=A0ABD2Z1K5_9GENT
MKEKNKTSAALVSNISDCSRQLNVLSKFCCPILKLRRRRIMVAGEVVAWVQRRRRAPAVDGGRRPSDGASVRPVEV